jgi:hypothetical protein
MRRQRFGLQEDGAGRGLAGHALSPIWICDLLQVSWLRGENGDAERSRCASSSVANANCDAA